MNASRPAGSFPVVLFVLILMGAAAANAGTFVVNNTADSGTGTLRQGILDANSNTCPFPCTISFDPTTFATTQTINLTSALTVSANGVFIDGFSSGTVGSMNTGAFGSADDSVQRVVINGASNTCCPITVTGANFTIRGLVLQDFQTALVIQGTGATITGMKIGTNATGTLAGSPQNVNGIQVTTSGSATIGGATAAERNLISGQTGIGIDLESDGNTVIGNYIGTNAAGTAAITNGVGVNVEGSSNVIGDATMGNLISGNSGSGVQVVKGNSTEIYNNRIGTSADGTAPVGNGKGIFVGDVTNLPGGVTIGGIGLLNLISGNTGNGIEINNSSGTNAVSFNRIGLNLDVSGTIPNSGHGLVLVNSGSSNVINGNLIGGNVGYGVTLAGGFNTVIQSNSIGYAAATPRPNGFSGIRITSATGATGVNSNTIRNNGGNGIDVDGLVIGVLITQNEIADNSGIGIDLKNGSGSLGATANDAGDTDTGAGNHLQNFPVITSATVDGPTGTSTLTLKFNVDSSNVGTTLSIRVEAFEGDTDAVNPEGFVFLQGQCFAGNNISNATMTIPTAGVAPGEKVVMTATSYGNSICTSANEGTSEFSFPAATVTATPGLVINTNNSGPGSLRQAITDANSGACASPCAITFNIPTSDTNFAGGVYTIRPLTVLPDILASNTSIDGATQTAFGGDSNPSGPEIVINGSMITGAAAGLQIAAVSAGQGNNIAIRNIVVNGFPGEGIFLDGSSFPLTNISITGNYVGTDPTGTSAVPNTTTGIYVGDSVSGSLIGALNQGNLISGNTQNGIVIYGASGNFVQSNIIGLNATGTAAIPNGFVGIVMQGGAQSNNIGGAAAGAGNTISGNLRQGIAILNTTTNGNILHGNYIGTATSGNSAIGNSWAGIGIWDGAQSNTIGGTNSGEGNLISGNLQDGVAIRDVATSSNIVAGNFIGTNASGFGAIANGWYGVDIFGGASNNTIGGSVSTARNVISGNTLGGVNISNSGTDGNLVAANLIGLNALASAALPNAGIGVTISSNANGNTIGGSTAAANTIAHNSGAGVVVMGAAVENNVRYNSIFSNTALGIDLDNDGVTPNDPGDGDTGGNDLQNFPVLSMASYNSGTNQTTISGTLNSLPTTQFDIDWYSNTTLDGSGHGEGQVYEATSTFTTDALGNANVSIVLAGNRRTSNIVATASRVNGGVRETSEFSAPAPNNPPVANNDTPAATNEDTPTTFDPRSNDSDPEGGTFTITSNGQPSPSAGSVTCSATSCTFTPAANYNGPASFNYTITDDMGATATATVNLTVNAINDPPVANTDAITTPEDTQGVVNVLTNDTDSDGPSAMTVTGNTNGANGAAVCSPGGNCTYTPTPNFTGTDSFTYTVTDTSASSVGTVNVTVNATNDPPVANTDTINTTEDIPGGVNVLTNDSDVDGPSALSVTGNTNGTKGNAVCTAAGNCTYTPNPDQNGPDSFTYTVSDGTASSVGTVNVNIAAINDPPVANPDAITTPEDTPGAVNVLANDTDSDGPSALTVTGNTNGANGTAVCSPSGNCTYTPNTNFTGTDSFTYTVSDSSASSVGTVNVTVGPLNDPPMANPDTINTTEDTPGSVNVLTNDTDLDGPSTLSVTGNTNGTKGTAVCTAAGNCTYTPNPDQNGADSFTYTVSDGAASSVGTVNVNIGAANDPPVANADALGTSEDTPNSVNVLANDSDVDGPSALTVTGNTNGTKGTAVCTAAGTCTYTPNPDQTGTDSFTYTVSDGLGSSVGTVNVTITGTNDAPVANPDTINTTEDTPGSVNVLTNDADLDGPSALSVTGNTSGTKGTAVCTAAGTCTYTPNPDQNGTDSFTYTVSDGTSSSVGTVNVNIALANDPPVANPDAITTVENTPGSVNVLANDTDVDGPSPLTVTGNANGTKGTASCTAAGNCTYTPNLNETGADSFTYTVSDGALSATGTVSVTIGAPNSPPNAAGDFVETLQDTPVTIDVLANDSDPDNQPLTLVANSQPANGSVTCQPDGSCTYTPNPGFTGMDSFTYTVQDSDGATSNATVTIDVLACPSGPQFLTPAPDATGVATTGRLSWEFTGASSYAVYLGRADGNGCSTPFATSLNTSIPYSNLEPNTRYLWRVESVAAGCPTASSACVAFTTGPSCNVSLILVKPLGGTVASPIEFEWQAVSGATQYTVFAKSGGGDFTAIGTTASTKLTASIIADGPVQWFVVATVPGCGNVQSSTATFDLCNTPGTPLARVVGEATSGQQYRVEWDAVPNAIRYEVDEATNADFIGATTISTTELSVAFRHELTAGPQPFHYRVRAFTACRQTAGDNSVAIRIVIIPIPSPSEPNPSTNVPAGSQEIVVQEVFVAGEPGQNLFFTAETDRPWLTVRPQQGVLPPNGITLEVVADPKALPNGTFTASIIVTITDGTSGRIGTNGTTVVTTPFSINLVTPVTPVPTKPSTSQYALVIPTAGHLDGIDSHWQSDIRVTNAGFRAARYQLTFTPSGGTAQGVKQTTINVDAGATTALDDIIRNWFGLGTLNDGANGMLEIVPIDDPATTSLSTVASSRTYNVTGNGTLGQYIPAVPFPSFIGRALPNALPQVLSLQQIAQNSSYRTNVGLAEAGGASVDAVLSVFNAGGSRLKDIPVSLAAGQQLQMNGLLATHGIELADGRIEVKVTGGNGKVTAYASVVDSKTQDPLLVSGTSLSAAGSTKFVLPGVANIDNALAHWRTDMRVFNYGTTSPPATLTFFPFNNGPSKTAQVLLTAGQVMTLDNVVKSQFGTENDGGVVHLTTAQPASLVVTGRTYNQTDNGTLGQFVPAVTVDQAVALNGRTLHILQVEDSTRYRTNLGLAEVSGRPATIEVQVVLPDSKVTPTVQIPLAPNEFRQFNLIRELGVGNVYNARITVRVIGGEGRVTAYGSVIDEVTQDPTYVPAQ